MDQMADIGVDAGEGLVSGGGFGNATSPPQSKSG
jgi:hypothetical protein